MTGLRVELVTKIEGLDHEEMVAQLMQWRADPEVWYALTLDIVAGKTKVWVGSLDGKTLAGMLILTLPDGLADMPQVAHFQCSGGAALRNEMITALVAFLRSAGYTHYLAINNSSRPDKAWMRAFRKGGKMKKVSSVIEFTLEIDDEQCSEVHPGRRRKQVRPNKHANRPAGKRVQGPQGTVLGRTISALAARWRPGIVRPARRRPKTA